MPELTSSLMLEILWTLLCLKVFIPLTKSLQECGTNQIIVNASHGVGLTGDIISPNLTNLTSLPIQCNYSIVGPENKHIRLQFIEFNIPRSVGCLAVSLKLSTVPTIDFGEKLPIPLCGRQQIDPIVIPTNTVTLTYQFTSDGLRALNTSQSRNHSVAFHVKYQVVNKANTTGCIKPIYAHIGDSGTIQSPNFPNPYPENIHCMWKIYSLDEHGLILLNFKAYHLEEWKDCRADFVYVGSDIMMSDFCSPVASSCTCGDEAPFEMVSRGYSLVIQFKSDFSKSYAGFQAHYQILPRADCSDSSLFECSAVQCISRELLCDGVADCTNGRDEYCNGTGLSDETCLRCNDGTCIAPFLSPYDPNYGKNYWWFCDGYYHCHDGTDETIDVCFTLGSRYHAMFECKGQSYDFMILHKQTCNGVIDCPGGEDEDPKMCHPKVYDHGWKPNAAVIILPLVLAVVVMAIFIVIYAVARKRQRNEEILRNFRRQKRFSSTVVTSNASLLMKNHDRFRHTTVATVSSSQSKV